MEIFLDSHPIFSTLPNLTYLTSETQKFKFDKFLPYALSPTQNESKEPKRSQINLHLDHETVVHILLEDAAYRCFDLAGTDLADLSPNRATHLKSPEKVKQRTYNKRTEYFHLRKGKLSADMQGKLWVWLKLYEQHWTVSLKSVHITCVPATGYTYCRSKGQLD